MLIQCWRTLKVYCAIAKDQNNVDKDHGHIITGDLQINSDKKYAKYFVRVKS